MKIQDSLKLCEKNKVKKNINRDNLYLTQTPQLFEYKTLYKEYLRNEKKLDNFTDDAQIFKKSNLNIYTVSGDIENIKLTTNEDWVNKINIIIIVEIAPVLPNSKVVTNALGISATIPENIIKDIPLPIPL